MWLSTENKQWYIIITVTLTATFYIEKTKKNLKECMW